MSTPTPTDFLIGSVKELLDTVEPSPATDAVRTALGMIDGGMTVEPDLEPEPDSNLSPRDVAARLTPGEYGSVIFTSFDLSGSQNASEVIPSSHAIDRLMEMLEGETVPLVAYREGDEETDYSIFFPETDVSDSFILVGEDSREADDAILAWKTSTRIINAVTEALKELPLREFITDLVNEAQES